MAKKTTISSGAATPFKDKDGNVIKVHDYVKDAEGNRYYVNSHCQAVPAGGSEAPAVELGRLIEETQVTKMDIQEVLNMEKAETTRRRGGRRKKEDQQAKPEADAGAAAPENTKDLFPVDEAMILSVLPDNVLANELRRRGYTLCAVRPALIEI